MLRKGAALTDGEIKAQAAKQAARVAATRAGTAMVSTTASVVGTGVGTGAAYAAMPCSFDQYYTIVMQPGGGYKKEAWDGDPSELPRRARVAAG